MALDRVEICSVLWKGAYYRRTYSRSTPVSGPVVLTETHTSPTDMPHHSVGREYLMSCSCVTSPFKDCPPDIALLIVFLCLSTVHIFLKKYVMVMSVSSPSKDCLSDIVFLIVFCMLMYNSIITQKRLSIGRLFVN